MLGLLLMLRRFTAAVRTAWRDPAMRGVMVSLIVLVIIATIFYSVTEGWSVLDSLYFSVVTGLTIGYGDFVPDGPLSKIFTMIYALLAVGLFVAFGAGLGRALIADNAAKRRGVRHRHRHDDGSDDPGSGDADSSDA